LERLFVDAFTNALTNLSIEETFLCTLYIFNIYFHLLSTNLADFFRMTKIFFRILLIIP